MNNETGRIFSPTLRHDLSINLQGFRYELKTSVSIASLFLPSGKPTDYTEYHREKRYVIRTAYHERLWQGDVLSLFYCLSTKQINKGVT